MAVIGLDLDGVVYKFTKSFATHVAKCKPELAEAIGDLNIEAPSWDWFIEWPLTRDEFVLEMEHAVALKELFWNAELYEANIPAQVKRLKDAGHTIEVVTHRFTPGASDATWSCLLRDQLWDCGVTFTKDKTQVKTNYFLEDNVDNYIALQKAGTLAFLINRPYNLSQPDAWRVDTFKQFVDTVLRIEHDDDFILELS